MEGEFPMEVHIRHCRYLLLQFIMCDADMGVVTFNKTQGMCGLFAYINAE
jgi:hypothetical protein